MRRQINVRILIHSSLVHQQRRARSASERIFVVQSDPEIQQACRIFSNHNSIHISCTVPEIRGFCCAVVSVASAARVLFCLRDSALQRKIQNESVCGDNHFRTGVVHHRSSRSDIECIGCRQQHPGSKSYTNTVSARLHNNFHCVYIFQKAQARGRFNKAGFDARVHYIPAESNAAARHMSYITEPLRLGNRKQPALIVQRP